MSERPSVWVIESGEYEDYGVFGVAASLDAAVTYIKGEFSEPPDRVKWSPLQVLGPGRAAMYGDFEHVPNISTKHRAHFDITEMSVHE